jgi:hypothetical protein
MPLEYPSSPRQAPLEYPVIELPLSPRREYPPSTPKRCPSIIHRKARACPLSFKRTSTALVVFEIPLEYPSSPRRAPLEYPLIESPLSARRVPAEYPETVGCVPFHNQIEKPARPLYPPQLFYDQSLASSSAGASPAVPAQMWHGRAQSRCRGGTGEPSPGADVAGPSPVPIQP